MKRIKHLLLTIAAVLGVYHSAQVQAGIEQQKPGGNDILERAARIQQMLDEQNKSDRVLDRQNVTQWYNFPNWPNWNDWNNWPNWYNY